MQVTMGRSGGAGKQRTLVGILVIAFATTVITVQCSPASSSEVPVVKAIENQQKVDTSSAQQIKAKSSSEPESPTKLAAVVSSVESRKSPIEASVKPSEVAKSPDSPLESKNVVKQPAENQPSAKAEATVLSQDSSIRKGRTDMVETPAQAATTQQAENNNKQAEVSPKSVPSESSGSESKPSSEANKISGKSASEQAKAAPGSKSQQQNNSKQQLAGKSGSAQSGKSKLPANLGTVTSTGSGGPAHYLSKHDAYSAIAEKHGALTAHDVVRKPDNRRQSQPTLQRFGGIQKASGIGDMLSPFKGVTDGGLARTLGASMRSIMKAKYSIPAYVASALLGAVALMAFYESPISPLPVPALPEPPVGRFPPEMPIIPPNTQVPFRGNQQYANQRSSNGQQQGPIGNFIPTMASQQQQQVLFPGNSMNAQQRQMTNTAAPGGPVQQLAANLLATAIGGKQQNAQRKSGPDYDLSSSRSFFGAATDQINNGAKLNSPANAQQQQQKSGSFLSYLGLGGGGSAVPSISNYQNSFSDLQQASNSMIEPKGSNGALSNSHLVNKVKSYFNRPSSPSSSSSSSSSSSNPYDQYQKMSLAQALFKDTAFIPGFLTTSRKSTPVSSSSTPNSQPSSPSSASSVNKVAPQPALARMQVDSMPQIVNTNFNQQTTPASSSKPRVSSGYGLMRTADRIAHALIDTLTSGLMPRNFVGTPVQSAGVAKPSQQMYQQIDAANRKSLPGDDQSSLLSASSLINDFVSTYGLPLATAAITTANQEQQLHNMPATQSNLHESNKQQSPSQQQQQATNSQSVQQPNQQHSQMSDQSQAAARSSDPATPVQDSETQRQATSGVSSPASSTSSASTAAHESAALSRKTRSIGFEYPIENHQMPLAQPQLLQGPSTAAQINHLVDFVSDSYNHNKLLFKFVMSRVGLSQAVPYVDQILAETQNENLQH